MDAWFSDGFHSLSPCNTDNRQLLKYAHFKMIKNAYECQQRRQKVH